MDIGEKDRRKRRKCVTLSSESLRNDFHLSCHIGWPTLQSNIMTTDFLFKNRYDICSNNEESFLLDPESNTGNRIESITQRTAIIEGKNKVFFVKISIGIFVLKTCAKLPSLGLLELDVIQMLIQKFREETVSELRLHGETHQDHSDSGVPR